MQDRFIKETKIFVSSTLFEPCQSQFFSGTSQVTSFIYLSNKYYSTDDALWRVTFSNIGGSLLLVSGKAEVGLKTQCVRCLNDAFIHVEGQVEGFVKLKSDAKLLGDAKEDECVCIQRDKTVDISTLIESAILLEVPTNPLCSKDCKGLFKYCNRGDRCMFPSNSPFEVLKNYEF